MFDCYETQNKVAKAYTSDFYKNISNCYNKCRESDKVALRKSIHDMLYKIEMLLDKNNISDKSD